MLRYLLLCACVSLVMCQSPQKQESQPLRDAAKYYTDAMKLHTEAMQVLDTLKNLVAALPDERIINGKDTLVKDSPEKIRVSQLDGEMRIWMKNIVKLPNESQKDEHHHHHEGDGHDHADGHHHHAPAPKVSDEEMRDVQKQSLESIQMLLAEMRKTAAVLRAKNSEKK